MFRHVTARLRILRDALTRLRQSRHKRWLVVALKILLIVGLVPGLLALVGYIIEVAVYRADRRPQFHVLYFAIAGWIAAPLILLRWFWRWPKHLVKLEFAVYLAQTVSFFVIINRISVTGDDVYQTNSFLRQEFKSDQFNNISSREDMWRWLHAVMQYVYDREEPYSAFSRQLSGRLTMATAVRVRQNRVKSENCSAFFTRTAMAGSSQCYPAFSSDTEDRSTFGKLQEVQFNYTNQVVNSTTGYPISMEDFKISGQFAHYPLAGFWVWFTPLQDYNGSLLMLELMKKSEWIDDHTRAIGLDVGIGLLDFIKTPLWGYLSFLVEVNTAGRLVPAQPHVDINFLDHFEDEPIESTNVYDQVLGALLAGFNLNTLDQCKIQTLRNVLRPLYLGVLPFLVYIIVNAVIDCVTDWRQFIHRPFNVTELLFAACVLSAISLLLKSLLFLDCSNSVFEQKMFDPVIGTDFAETSAYRYAVRYEVLPVATVWTTARQVIGIAIFLLFFNFLRFLLKLKALGVLVRTLRFAALDLMSFSFSFLVLFSGFAAMFFYIFSIESNDFRTLSRTVTSLWLGMLGELQVTPELWRGGTITIGLFIVFTFLSAFVLLTTIVSIISRAHDQAHKYDAPPPASDRKPGRVGSASGGGGKQSFDDVISTADAASDETDSADPRLISEGEVMLKTLRKWRSSTVKHRRSHKVSAMETLENPNGDVMMSDGKSQCSTSTLAGNPHAGNHIAVGMDLTPTASTTSLISRSTERPSAKEDTAHSAKLPPSFASTGANSSGTGDSKHGKRPVANGGWTNMVANVKLPPIQNSKTPHHVADKPGLSEADSRV
eukprot:scpid27797/ scgid31581/ Polycystic kidney disease and receptor for egg jelly-related protein; PKD and REJ homolog